MDISEFQYMIWKTYRHHDEKRGLMKTYKWLVSEVEELGRALSKNNIDNIKEELADVLAWLSSVANLLKMDLEEVCIARYGAGCPKCRYIPCRCTYREKP